MTAVKGRSAICRARNPDSGRTGYGWTLQCYDKRARRWRWEIVGLMNGRRFLPELRRQIDADDCASVPLHRRGVYRFAFVDRWRRVRGGWRAIITKIVGPLEKT